MDATRWSLASRVFTSIFSTSHKPPINIYDCINEQFINSLLDLVEQPPNENIQISPESSIPPILAFNLHFQSDDYNYVINSLRNRSSANHLLENLMSYLNWGEDPTRITSILSNEFSDKDSNNNFNLELEQLDQNELEQLDQTNKVENANNSNNDQIGNKFNSYENRPNAVHKLLLEIFDDEIISNIFYYNDICVLIDILVTFLNNSNSNDKVNFHFFFFTLKK